MWLLLLTSLLAQSPGPRAEARRLFEQGEAQFSAGALRAAEQSFTQSYALLPLAATAWNLARCTEAANAQPLALGWYRRYLRLDPAAKDRAEVEASIRKLEKQLATRKVQALTFFFWPPEATASINRGPPVPDGATVELEPGKYQVVVSAPGAVSAQAEVNVTLATSQEVAVTLAGIPVETDEHGFVQLPHREPLAVASTDVPLAPPEAPALTPAPAQPQVSVVRVPLPPERKLRVTWVGAGLTVAAIITGVACGVAATSASNDLRDGRVRGQVEVNELKNTITTTTTVSGVSWITAGVAAAGTAVALGFEW